MTRQIYKTVTNPLVEFIPKVYQDDKSLDKNAPKIADRPLICMVRKLTREQNLNLQSLLDFKPSKDNPTKDTVENFGTAAKYIWEHCVIQVKNVLLNIDGEDKEFETLEGRDKNALFETKGIDYEIAECIQFIQSISNLTEVEAKN